MKEKREYHLLQLEIYRLQDDLIRTSDGFADGNGSSSGNEGEWDVFD